MSDPSFRAGQTLPAADLQDLGEYGAWTPTLTVVTGTSPTLGSGSTIAGIYHRNGRAITTFFDIRFGSSGVAAGSGTYQIGGLPFPIDSFLVGSGLPGHARCIDNSANQDAYRFARAFSTTQVIFGSQGFPAVLVDENDPFGAAWAANDQMRGGFTYIADI